MRRLRLTVVKYKKFILLILLAILAVFTFRKIVNLWQSLNVPLPHVPTSRINNDYWQQQRYVVLRSLKQDTPATIATLLQNPTAAENSFNCRCTDHSQGVTTDYDLILHPSNISSNTSHNSQPTSTFSLHLLTTDTPVRNNDTPAAEVPSSSDSKHDTSTSESGDYDSNTAQSSDQSDTPVRNNDTPTAEVPSSSDSKHDTSESGDYDSNIAQSSDEQNATATETKHYLLFVAILSQYEGYNSRVSIRKTWMEMHNQDSENSLILFKFVIGTMNLSAAAIQNLIVEEDANHDLLLLPHLIDSYNNLTRKVLYTLVWADENVSFSYLLKCDTDSFVFLNRLTQELSKRTSTKDFYWGYFVGFNNPIKGGRWPEYKWFLCDHYLPYAVGGGYVISSNLVHRLAVNSDGLQLYVCEDVSVGVWLSPFNIERKHDVRFDTGHKSRGCSNQYLISHKQSPEDMYRLYSNLLKTGKLCESEISVYKSYVYDWHTQPTKCCTRSASNINRRPKRTHRS